MADTALQRKNMVESQVRPSDVTDRRITAAMMAVPRESFLPPALKSLAYMDESIEIAPGSALLAPRDFARLVQLADIGEKDRVLVIGGAGGYAAAVLARLGGSVVVVSPNADMQRAVSDAVSALGVANVASEAGPLASGFAAGAPYDVIFIEGAVDVVPDALLKQLSDDGRLIAVQSAAGVNRALAVTCDDNVVAQRSFFEANAPKLSGFERADSGFQF